MSMKAQGVISRKVGEPTELEEIQIDSPGPGEVLVRIQASGVCHTDLHYKLGAINDDFPFLLGHEGAGIVEEVGGDVLEPKVGDYVILAWRAPCGNCRFCLNRPALPLFGQPQRRAAYEDFGGTGVVAGPGNRHILHPYSRFRQTGGSGS